jgi:hypothetical protein
LHRLQCHRRHQNRHHRPPHHHLKARFGLSEIRRTQGHAERQ